MYGRKDQDESNAEHKKSEKALRKSEEQARQLAQENSIMAEIGRIISSTLNIEEVYEHFTEELKQLIPVDRTTFTIINPGGSTITYAYVSGVDIPEYRAGRVISLTGSTTEKAIAAKQGLIIEVENEEEVDLQFPTFSPVFNAGIRSVMAIPLISKDQVIAVLTLQSMKRNAYTDHDLRIAGRVGNQIAGAIANAQIYDRLSKTEESLRRSEKKFRDLYDNAPVGYHELDTEGQITNVNRADLEMLGYSRAEVIGEYIWKFNENEAIVRKSVLEKLSGLQPPGWSFERTYRRKDGTPLPILLKDLLNRDEQGRITGIRVAVQDISEQKRTEEALRESEQRFRTTFEKTGVGMVITDMEANFIEVNPAFCEFLGYDRDELLKMKVTDVTSLEDLDETKKLFSEIASKIRSGINLEKRYIRKDGATVWGHITSASVSDSESKPNYSVAVIRDITQRKQMEEALKRSEERFRDLYDYAPIGYHELDMEGRITTANRMELEMLGHTVEEMIGEYVWKFNIEEESARERILAKLAGTVRPSQNSERTYRRKGGTTFPVLINDRLVFDEEGRIKGMRCTIQDITDRKKMEDALRQTNETLHRLIQVSPLAIVTLDSQKKIVRWNFAAERLFGWTAEEVLGRPVPTIPEEQKEEFNEMFEKELTGKKLTDVNLRRLRKDGSLVDVSLWTEPLPGPKGEVIGALGIYVDMTERKQAEKEKGILQEQLHQSQKMESIGRLAGGVAHDFNNLLTVIRGYSELSLGGLQKRDPLREHIEEIQKAAERAADLTRQLLAFSRRQILEFKTVNLNNLIQAMEKMLRRMIGEDIELMIYPEEDLGSIRTDPGQMEQVIMNLAVNARDAMPSGGKLILEMGNVYLDEEYARNHISVKPGPYVRVSITDTGCGMLPEVRERVFEPFFTTKEKGKGTGLGLSTVYGIIKQSDGNIWVYSELGKGTTFKIYLPRIDKPVEVLIKKEELKEIPRGNETVLVVEDEEVVRKLAVQILKHWGYKVLEAALGGEALLVLERHKGPIHLILTDVVMPGMSGPELVERLRQVRKDFKVLYMSGYTDESVIYHGVREGEMNFIQKPFTLEILGKKVREVLDEVSEDGSGQISLF